MVTTRLAAFRRNHLGVFPQDQNTEAVVQGDQGCISCRQPKLVMCKSQVTLFLKTRRGNGEQLRAGSMWQGWESLKRGQERPLVKIHPQLQWRLHNLEIPVLWDDHQGQQQTSLLCCKRQRWIRGTAQAFGAQKIAILS